MMRVLGARRILVLVTLLAINVVLAAGLYVYMEPQKAKKQKNLQALQSENSRLQGDIDRLLIEFDQLEAQQEQFTVLSKRGFLGKQNRRQAERLFEKIANEAGVIWAVANIQSGKVESNEESEKAGYKILRSPILVEIKALDDIDVFRYIYLVENFFPGHVTIENITLERKGRIGGAILRSIAGGDNPDLVKASMVLVWRTMIPEEDVIDKTGTN